jgi:hypothetical protein
VLLPFVLSLVYIIAYKYRNKHYGYKHPWRKYFIPALTVKVFGAIFIGLVYAYYYKGGDTFNYFHHSLVINEAFDESIIKWLNLIFNIPAYDDGAYYDYISRMEWYRDPSSYTVAATSAFFSLFFFNTYLPTTVIFALISFTGVWALFRTFATNYPKLVRPISVAILFIPSTFVWGSGIFKDTICLFGLGWLAYGSFRLIIQRDFTIKNILLTIMSFILIATVKLYVLMGFVPALLIWILFVYSQKIKIRSARLLIKLFFSVAAIGASLFFMQRFGEELGKYSLEKIEETSNVTRTWINYSSEKAEGASYNLGEFDPSIGGMVTKFPAAVNVTFFRPYPWEAGKVIVLLSAIEALLFLFVTLKVIFTIGLPKIWTTINKDPTIQFCLIFSTIFAFAVGISSYNFGALSRYKIPCLPFYAMALILIYYKNKPLNKKLIGFLGI